MTANPTGFCGNRKTRQENTVLMGCSTEHTEENTDSAAGERPACPLKRTPTERKWHLRKPACHNAISRSVGMPRCNRGIQPAVTMLPHSDVLSLSV